jgi:uncharacterized protein YacL
MREWLISTFNYFLGNWRVLFVGGVITVSLTIFIMSLLKKYLFKKFIKHITARHIITAWSSLIVTLPITAVSILWNDFDPTQFWSIYLVNCVGVILGYWGFEHTVRDWLVSLGRKIVLRFAKSFADNEDPKKVTQSINKDVESLLVSKSASLHKYKDDDLKKL